MPKKIYELVMWIAGRKITLGHFLTNKEAKEALSLVKKYYTYRDKRLQDMIHDKNTGYRIIVHDVGFEKYVETTIRDNMEAYHEEIQGIL